MDLLPRIDRFIRRGEGEFEALALSAFAFQYERIAPYRRWCERQGRTPRSVEHWRDVPAVPATAFKSVRLCAAPPKVTFRSSGTTRGSRRSEHHHPYPELYRRVVGCSFPRYCLPQGGRVPMLSLVPPLTTRPDSSLSFMIDHVLASLGGEGSACAVAEGGLRLEVAESWLTERARRGEHCLVLATALSLHQCLTELGPACSRLRLAEDSAVFVTGGFKTHTASLSLDLLLGQVEETLGLGRSRVVQEYGMTELTSQAYTRALEGGEPTVFVCPTWMRFRILDPSTLDEVGDGGEGILALFDLANLGSALHLLTEDVAQAVDDGFRLAGRAEGAELRGCSLTAEELAAAAR